MNTVLEQDEQIENIENMMNEMFEQDKQINLEQSREISSLHEKMKKIEQESKMYKQTAEQQKERIKLLREEKQRTGRSLLLTVIVVYMVTVNFLNSIVQIQNDFVRIVSGFVAGAIVLGAFVVFFLWSIGKWEIAK